MCIVFLSAVVEGADGIGDCGMLIVLTLIVLSAPLILPFSHHPDTRTHATAQAR